MPSYRRVLFNLSAACFSEIDGLYQVGIETPGTSAILQKNSARVKRELTSLTKMEDALVSSGTVVGRARTFS